MRRTAEFIASLALLAGLNTAGYALAAVLTLPVPGPIIGLSAYILLLSLGLFPGSKVAARWLAGLLGALIVPPLVGVGAFAPVLAAGGWRLAFALIAGTLITGVVTAATFRAIANSV